MMALIADRVKKEVTRLHNPEKGNPCTDSFKIEKALKADFGREVARMHWSKRRFASRYDIVRITHDKRQVLVPILGLDGQENTKVAKLGYDLRTRLGIHLSGDNVELTVEQVGWWGQLYWYLSTKDPAVKVPAWLAVWSVLLGFFGLVLALLSIVLSFL